MVERRSNDRANRVHSRYVRLITRIYLYRTISCNAYTTAFKPVRIRHHARAVDEHVSLHAVRFSGAIEYHPLQARRTLYSNQSRLRWRNQRDCDPRACQPLRGNAGVAGVTIDDGLFAG